MLTLKSSYKLGRVITGSDEMAKKIAPFQWNAGCDTVCHSLVSIFSHFMGDPLARMNPESTAHKLQKKKDKSILRVLRSLSGGLRVCVGRLKSPYAESIQQVLDVLCPVLASVQHGP